MSDPLVSVIMAVYNTKEEYLRKAIESILIQSYSTFEYIIIDDNSDSWCSKVIESYTNDKRVKIYRNEKNIGLTKSLNKALDLASGKYIARMDSDDISYPKRLEYQVEYMNKHCNVAVVGTLAITSDTNECIGYLKTKKKELLKVYMLFQNDGIIHPTAMIRRDFLLNNNIKYDVNILKAQDYALWTEILKYGEIRCINKILLMYRRHEGQITKKSAEEQKKYTNIIIDRQFKKMHIYLDERELKMIGQIRFQENIGSLNEMYRLIRKIDDVNREGHYYNKYFLHRELVFYWFLINKSNKNIWKYSMTYHIFDIRNLLYFFLRYMKSQVGRMRCFRRGSIYENIGKIS